MAFVKEDRWRNPVQAGSLGQGGTETVPNPAGVVVVLRSEKYISTGTTININKDTAAFERGKRAAGSASALTTKGWAGTASGQDKTIAYRKALLNPPRLSNTIYFLSKNWTHKDAGLNMVVYQVAAGTEQLTIGKATTLFTIANINAKGSAEVFDRTPKNTQAQQDVITKTTLQQVSQEQARARENARTNGRSGRNRRTQRRRRQPPPPSPRPFVTRTRVETTNTQVGSVVTPESGKPYFLQRYSVLTGTSSEQTDETFSDIGQARVLTFNETWEDIDRRFALDIVPGTIEFSQMSAVWSEIEKSADYSLVEFSKNNLLRVSFRFLVAAQNPGPSQTFNGLQISIDAQLETLRSMAATDVPVQLINFSDYLTNTYRYPFLSKHSGIFFVIQDMTVSANRFVNDDTLPLDRQGSLRRVASAEVSVTLTEFPVRPNVPVVQLPPLKLQTPTPNNPPPSIPTNGRRYNKITELLPPGFIYVPPPTNFAS